MHPPLAFAARGRSRVSGILGGRDERDRDRQKGDRQLQDSHRPVFPEVG